MSRRTIHVLKGSGENESTKTSVHGSQYNADAASAEVCRMGPSHSTMKAQRLIEATCNSRKVALLPISEARGKDAVVAVSNASRKTQPKCSELLKSIGHDRRQAQREMQHLKEVIQHWMKDSKAGSQNRRAERYQNAVKFQEELRKLMHTTRSLRNQCKALTYDGELDTVSEYTRRPEIEDIECRLGDMAAAVEELQSVVDAERRRMLKLVEEGDVNRARRKKPAE